MNSDCCRAGPRAEGRPGRVAQQGLRYIMAAPLHREAHVTLRAALRAAGPGRHAGGRGTARSARATTDTQH